MSNFQLLSDSIKVSDLATKERLLMAVGPGKIELWMSGSRKVLVLTGIEGWKSVSADLVSP